MNNIHTHAVYSLNNAVVCQNEEFFRLMEDVLNNFPCYPFELSSNRMPGHAPVHIDLRVQDTAELFRKNHRANKTSNKED